MSGHSDDEARLLSAAEREAVDLTRHPAVTSLSRDELQALAKRLRDARDRARDIGRQQRREMRGKAEPRGTTPARDNTGTVGKAEAIALALRRISHQLRRDRLGETSEPDANRPTRGPPRTRAASKGGLKSLKAAPKKPGSPPKLRVDPREIGRVSQAGKRAQARRDSKRG